MKLFNFSEKRQNPVLDDLWNKGISNAVYRLEFLKKLLTEELVILIEPSPLKGTLIIENEYKVRVFTFPGGEVPIFTSTDRIFDNERITYEVGFFEITGRSLFEKFEDTTFVLNPNSNQSKVFAPQEIDDLLNGSYFHKRAVYTKIEVPSSTMIVRPPKHPTEVVQALVELFKKRPGVILAYLGWVNNPASNIPPHYVFAIQNEGNWEELCSEVVFLVGQLLGPDQVFDIMQTQRQRGVRPFYMKDI